jgi:hypothetical protein
VRQRFYEINIKLPFTNTGNSLLKKFYIKPSEVIRKCPYIEHTWMLFCVIQDTANLVPLSILSFLFFYSACPSLKENDKYSVKW